MKIFFTPNQLRADTAAEFQRLLAEGITNGMNQYKRKLKKLFEEMDIADGLKFVFSEFLPAYLEWDLEFVDLIGAQTISPQVTPRAYNYDSYSWFSGFSWS